MKQLIQLSNEFILDVKFRSKSVYVEGRGSTPDWIDDDKKLANGKDSVEAIELIVRQRNEYGVVNGKAELMWLYKDDILKLAEKIKEIESVEKTGYPTQDDLPF